MVRVARSGTAPTFQLACRCAISDGIPRRSLYVALVVGTILNLINQGDALGDGSINWLKVALTYVVPFYSYDAIDILRPRGFRVRRLQGGFSEWLAAGLPIERESASGRT